MAQDEDIVDNPVFESWHESNEWYLSDDDMTNFANSYVQTKPELNQLPYKQLLSTVTEVVKRRFPQKFGESYAHRPVEGGGEQGAAKPRKPGWNDLPLDAKRAGDRYVKQGLFRSKSDYAKSYFKGD